MLAFAGYYLIEIKNNSITNFDGAHSTKEEAKKALEYWEALRTIKNDCDYKIIKIDSIEDL